MGKINQDTVIGSTSLYKTEILSTEEIQKKEKNHRRLKKEKLHQSDKTLLKTTFLVLFSADLLKTKTREAEVHRENATYN